MKRQRYLGEGPTAGHNSTISLALQSVESACQPLSDVVLYLPGPSWEGRWWLSQWRMGTLEFIQGIHLTKVISLVSRMNNLALFTPKVVSYENHSAVRGCTVPSTEHKLCPKILCPEQDVLMTTSTYRHFHYLPAPMYPKTAGHN